MIIAVVGVDIKQDIIETINDKIKYQSFVTLHFEAIIFKDQWRSISTVSLFFYLLFSVVGNFLDY